MELVEHRQSVAISMLLHLGVLLFAAFGLPHMLPPKPDPIPLVMSIEVLPITGVTNVKPSDKPLQEEKKTQAPTIKKPVPPTTKEPPKSAEKIPEKDVEPLPKDAAKPKDEKAKDSKKPDDFAALLNQLQQEAKSTKDAKDTAHTEENKTKSDAPYDPGVPLSLSETDAIRSQFIPCWRMPIGAKDPASLAARVHITLQADGTVLTAELTSDQRSRYAGDPFFRAAADAALRAVHQCSPLKNLPPEKYNSWRDMELNFNPADLM